MSAADASGPGAGSAPPLLESDASSRSAPPGRVSWRDPWLWLSLLAIVPVVLHSLGAPFGEPVADDWDMLHRVLLTDERSLLDGGGSAAFWRPIPHQLYYLAFASLMLSHPAAVAGLHGVLVALVALLVYRAARTRLPGPWAAAVASFPLLAESARALVVWPSHMVELSFLLFSALALHEAAFRRLPTALLALLAALLCKEMAVVTALLLPWLPGGTRAPATGGPLASIRIGRERRLWILCTAGVVLAWGLAYLAVRNAHGLRLPHGLETAPETLATPWLVRYGWGLANSLRAAFSLPIGGSPRELAAWGGLLALAAAAAWMFAARAGARARLAAALPAIVFGLLWFAVAAVPLTVVHPFWMPHRALFGGLGLAIALVAALGAARPALLAGLVALRLALFVASPGATKTIAMEPPASGAFLDFEKVTRLQRVMRGTRTLLASRFPTLPSGASVGLHHPPIMTRYAYGGSLALQSWYRDTTLRWLRYEEFRRRPERLLAAIVHYEPGREPPLMLLEPEAMQHYLRAGERLRREDWRGALGDLAAADSLQRDTTARVFTGRVAGRRALCWLGLGRAAEAECEARRALARWRESSDARYTLASVLAFGGRAAEARTHLDTLLRLYPDDRSARTLMDSLESWSSPRR